MALPEIPFVEIDFLEQARSRKTEQFKYKDNIDRYIQLLIDQTPELQNVFKQLKQDRSIDTAVGKQLDILGDIVGQSRIVADADLVAYFGFRNTFLAESLGDLNNPAVGGIFLSLGESPLGTRTLSDDAYRIFIKARIIKNNTRATPDEFLDMFKFVFNTENVFLQEIGNANIRVDLAGDIGTFEKIILRSAKEKGNILPVPIGVGFESAEYDPENFFSFLGVPGGRGFGSLEWISTYNGVHQHNASIFYDSERAMATEDVYSDMLDGTELLNGTDTLNGGAYITTRIVGGIFSSII